MSSILRSSKFVRYFFGLARSIISNRQEIDGGLLHRSHNLTGIFSNNQSSNLSTLQYGAPLEQSIRQLDEDARRMGRVSFSEIEEVLNSIKDKRKATSSQSLMVIRCCGNLVPEETPEQRTKLVEEIWKTFEKLGVPLDISHYNALLKVYLENEHKFSPTEFLAKLEQNGIEPNRVTYQRLIAGFCQQGDIEGATKILEFMKDKQIPVSEGVFNALILGHSKADDMESAEGILTMMRQANVEPSNETYTTLLRGYAAKGDEEAVRRVLTECKVKDVLLSDRDFLEIGYTAVVNGHDQLMDEIMKNIRHSMGYNQDAANVIIRLLTVGKDEAAYKVFQSMNPGLRSEVGPNMSGHIFIKHLVKSNWSVDQILSWCDRLQRDGHTPLGLWIAVDASFHHNNTQLTVELLRVLRQKGEPVRPHYFWPSLVTAGKASDFDRMKEILMLMKDEFELSPNSETLQDYFLPYVPSSLGTPNELLKFLDSVDVRKGQAVTAIVSHLLNKNKVQEAADVAFKFPNLNYKSSFTTRQLIDVLETTRDVRGVVGLLKVLSSSQPMNREEEVEESGSGEEIVSRFLINLVSYAPTQNYITDVLKVMLELGIPVSNVCAEIVQNKLQGGVLTPGISEMLAELSSGNISSQPIKRTASPRTAESILRMKERMVANGEPVEKIIGVHRSLHQQYCHEGDVENALKIKQEMEEKYNQEPTLGMWASLIDAYCIKNDLENAKQCLEKIKGFSSGAEVELDGPKILSIAKLMVDNNQIDDAEELLKTVKMREKDVGGMATRNCAWKLLQAVAETYKDPERVKKMLNLLAERKFVEVSNIMLGAIMKAHLIRGDLEGALKEFEECVKLHRATPSKNELTMKFIEKEDATNLQTIVDLSTEVHGEVNSLYDLVLSFIECGKIRQARKILETPGLTGRANRITSACERFKKEGKVDCLEGLVEATKDVSAFDRSEIYSTLLDTYCEVGEVEKALGLWTKMQDEDVNVTDEFLIKLGNFLKEKGHEVPFEIPRKDEPKTTETTKEKKERVTFPASSLKSKSQQGLLAAISNKDADKALKIKDEMVNAGEQPSRTEVSRLLDLLVVQGRLREAVALVAGVGADRPLVRSLRFLIGRLSAAGELDLLQRVEQCLNEELRRITTFSNKLMTAAVEAGKVKDVLNKMEAEIDAASSSEDIDNLTSKFPRGGIMAVLEKSPSDYEQVARIVEKFHSKGSFSPANCLVMHHLSGGEVEKARELFQKYKLDNSSQLAFRSVLRRARVDKKPELVEELISMVGSLPAITPEAKGLLYSNLINIYNDQGNYDTALQKLDEAVKTVPLEMFYTSALSRLKTGLEENNKSFKYTIPQKKQQKESSSSSSSSSESEPKKSVAAN